MIVSFSLIYKYDNNNYIYSLRRDDSYVCYVCSMFFDDEDDDGGFLRYIFCRSLVGL